MNTYMKRALELAKLGKPSPNPYVGCVIVKDDEVVGEGYHEKFGEAHAEINALKQACDKAKGATMYVTLEPCCHHGKTPPCVDAIIKAGVSRVVIGMLDPNELVNGKGVERLNEAVISVEVLDDPSVKRLNEVFFHYVKTKKPYVVLKTAMTLDGKITADGWVTNEKSREFGHKLRDMYDAILVGTNTLKIDNPKLTCRIDNGRDPVRVILDRKLEIPLDHNVYNDDNVIVAITAGADTSKLKCRFVVVREKDGKIDIEHLLELLGKEGITSLFVEGGSAMNTSFFELKFVNKMFMFIAPKLVGEGLSFIKHLNDTVLLNVVDVKRFDEDIMIEAYPQW